MFSTQSNNFTEFQPDLLLYLRSKEIPYYQSQTHHNIYQNTNKFH